MSERPYGIVYNADDGFFLVCATESVDEVAFVRLLDGRIWKTLDDDSAIEFMRENWERCLIPKEDWSIERRFPTMDDYRPAVKEDFGIAKIGRNTVLED
jgi:hypothetical protein